MRSRETAESPPAVPDPSGQGLLRLVRPLLALALLCVAGYLALRFAESLQYALTRGRQRAELEVATEGLTRVSLEDISKASQLVSQRVGPSVVHLRVASLIETRQDDEFDSLFGYRRPETEGQGSGVIVDQSGFILTNKHVVEGATKIRVTLSDGRIVDGNVVGVDALTDLAVVKVQAGDLTAAEWGDSDELEVGALVWALGSPFGLQQTITFGILSAKNRGVVAGSVHQDFLQTDAAVNPGNSGGPLVDARGRVIGLNTAIVGPSYQGISFAIPSSVARPVYEKLRSSGHVDRGWLGVQLGDVTAEAAQEFGWPVDHGAYVHGIVNDRRNPPPAQRAGIRPGDIIIKWDGKDVNDSASLTRMVARTQIGSTVEAVVMREGRETPLSVQVASRPLQLP